MKRTRILMGMPITIEVVDPGISSSRINEIFSYFKDIDNKFSTYKRSSEVSMINNGRLKIDNSSHEIKEIFKLAEETRKRTNGYFDIYHRGKFDPSGIVKGWAILNAAKILKKKGFKNFYIDCGGDIQSYGKNRNEKPWKVGIRNPFKTDEIIKVISPQDRGVATSGIYERGNHIYDPKSNQMVSDNIVSLTVIGPNIYEADRFATAAFAMGRIGVNFIEKLVGFEAYMVDKNGFATYTSGFEEYTLG